jgi:hypothetical protein
MRVFFTASVLAVGDASRNMFASRQVPAPQLAHPAPQIMQGFLPQPAVQVSSLSATRPGASEVFLVPRTTSRGWSDMAMLAVAGAIAGAAGTLAFEGRRASSIRMQDEEMEEGSVEAAEEAAPPAEDMEAAQPKVEASVATPAEEVALAPSTGGALYTQSDLAAQSDLAVLAKNLNPAVGFWDPLKLSELEFWEQSNEATIGFLRHAEIKHGRVAMAGFVGFIVHANGIHFPWKIPGDELCAPGVSPPLLWNNLPEVAKVQIIIAVAIFEAYSEAAMAKSPDQGGHYMRGGKPGYFPPFILPGGGKSGVGTLEDDEGAALLPHPVPLNLYDPLNFNKKKSEEWKAQKLNVELNNGRLAMLGLMSFLSEGAIPGSVPALKGLIPESGAINVMRPLDFMTPFSFTS